MLLFPVALFQEAQGTNLVHACNGGTRFSVCGKAKTNLKKLSIET